MKRAIIKVISKFRITSYPFQIYSLSRNLLSSLGWIEAKHQNMAIDKSGNPIPWLTYSFLSFVEERIQNDFSLFEYGSGNSTIWFAPKVKSIISIEYDEKYYNYVKSKIGDLDNVTYLQREVNKNYSQEILNHKNEFDIVLIDGRERSQCALNAVESLTDRGVIIWDNSEREQYQEAQKKLIELGFKRIGFKGLAPASLLVTETTVFYKEGNCLNI